MSLCFATTEDQRLVHDTTTRYIRRTWDIQEIRSIIDAPAGTWWPRFQSGGAELGWFGLFVPEELGGGTASGSAVLDALIIAGARGAALAPGPFVSVSAAALALSRASGDTNRSRVLKRVASGEALVTWAGAGGSASYEPGAGVVARAGGGGYQLAGVKRLVELPGPDGYLLVDARHERGVTQFLVPLTAAGLTVSPLTCLDVTRPLAEVILEDAYVPGDHVVGSPFDAAADVSAQFDLAAVLATGELVGAMDRLLEMTVEYAKDRVALGRRIGSFQAVKHLLADLSMLVETAKAGTLAAAQAVDGGRADAAETVSIVKAFAGESAIDVGQGCFQVHGGIGFTWEHDLHLYLRRLTADRALYGDPEWHHERVCRAHGL